MGGNPQALNALPACLRPQGETLLLSVKVTPRASRNEISGLHGDLLKVKVTAPPVDSAANEALLRFLAETLGCHRNALQIVRGGASRQKVIAVTGLSAETVAAKIAA